MTGSSRSLPKPMSNPRARAIAQYPAKIPPTNRARTPPTADRPSLLPWGQRWPDEPPGLIDDDGARQDHPAEQRDAQCQREGFGRMEEGQRGVVHRDLVRPSQDLDDLLVEGERRQRADPDPDERFDQPGAKLAEMVHEIHGLVGHAAESSPAPSSGSAGSSADRPSSSGLAGFTPISVTEAVALRRSSRTPSTWAFRSRKG